MNATFGLQLTAQRGAGGTYRFDINVEQEWADQNGTWKIQKETWINNGYDFNAVTSTGTANARARATVGGDLLPRSPRRLQADVDDESCVTDSAFSIA